MPIALAFDRAPGIIRPLVRHGRALSIIGGLLVVAIGIAMMMDWLALLPAAASTFPVGHLSGRPATGVPAHAERRGLIGPFSGRLLLFAFGAVIVGDRRV